MNKIILTEEKLIKQLDENIVVIENGIMERFGINEYTIYIHNSTELCIIIENNTKVSFNINLDNNVNLTLYEIQKDLKTKIKYKYTLLADTNLIVNKINSNIETKEYDLINLNGTNAKIDFILKNISFGNDNIDIIVNHNIKETTSNIKCDGLCSINGNLNLTVTTIVPTGSINCIANQDNEIIKLNNLTSTIKPLLLIEEYNVEASHSAKIGFFKENDLFYLQSRGLNKKEATNLLIKSFLKRNLINNEIINDFFKKMEVKYE